MDYTLKASKVLSRNDTGETHSHQSGISIVRQIARSGIFPTMTTDVLNPRVNVSFIDGDGITWTFPYIYYNDKYFGKPASKCHDEFRITCVKDFINRYSICSGDTIWFAVGTDGNRYIGYEKANSIVC